jgi:hypothetical protein
VCYAIQRKGPAVSADKDYGHTTGDARKRIRELIALESEAAEADSCCGRDGFPNVVLGEE